MVFPQRVELWFGTVLPEYIPRRVKQRSQQVQRRHLEQVQERHLIYASRSSREAVANACIRSTTRPKANRLRTTHPDEDVTGHRLRYHLGPYAGP